MDQFGKGLGGRNQQHLGLQTREMSSDPKLLARVHGDLGQETGPESEGKMKEWFSILSKYFTSIYSRFISQ